MGQFLDKYFKQEPQNISTLDSVESVFETLNRIGTDGYFYRGVSDSEYGLESTLERTGGWDTWQSEDYLLKEFDRRKHEYISAEEFPKSKFELLALMQHYGVPTRLLDVTRSPYVGLYFAVSNYFKEIKEENQKDGALYTFHYSNLHVASIRFMQQNLQNIKVDYNFIAHALRNDRELFENIFKRNNDNLAFFLEPYKFNTRLNIQQGLFLITNFSYKSSEEIIYNLLERKKEGDNLDLGGDPTIHKFIIPYKIKKEILKRLFLMNINSATLFPGLEGFSKYLKENNMITETSEKVKIHQP